MFTYYLRHVLRNRITKIILFYNERVGSFTNRISNEGCEAAKCAQREEQHPIFPQITVEGGRICSDGAMAHAPHHRWAKHSYSQTGHLSVERSKFPTEILQY